MSASPELRFDEILRALAEADVEFIVVGGVCAALHGAPVTTFDLNVVHRRIPENIARLLTALESLNARFRFAPHLAPNASHLASRGHQLLTTRFGPLDVLGSIAPGDDYEALAEHVVSVRLTDELTTRTLDLDTLIAAKESAAGEKDHAILPILRRLRAESRSDPYIPRK